jgi:NitT/TauT family transport system ATP-binding protein
VSHQTALPAAEPAAEPDAAPAVAFNGIRVAYGGQNETYVAVARADLHVRRGEFVAIVGPTGCGKSTLLNVAAGLIQPSAGECRIDGAPLAGINREAGYLFQTDALMPWKTAVENVAIGLAVRGIRRIWKRPMWSSGSVASRCSTTCR